MGKMAELLKKLGELALHAAEVAAEHPEAVQAVAQIVAAATAAGEHK